MIAPAPPPCGGGMESYMENIIESELPKIVKMKLLNTKVPKIFVNFRFIRISLTIKFVAQLVFYLFTFFPNIVHIHTSSYIGFWEKSLFVLIAKLFKRKAILHIHGSGFDKFCDNSRCKKYIYGLLNLCDKIIVLSLYWKDFLKKYIPSEKIIIIENGINIQHYYSIPNNQKYLKILFVGLIGKRKGLHVILDSILNSSILQSDYIQFYFMGDAILKKDYQEIIDLYKNNNLTNTHFLGKLDGNQKYYHFRNSDIFILPSYAEGFPMAILEAMASSLPIISTTVGGIPDLVKSENGILISPGDSEALKNALQKLIENPTLRKSMGDNNRKKIENEYSISRVIKELVKIYQNIK